MLKNRKGAEIRSLLNNNIGKIINETPTSFTVKYDTNSFDIFDIEKRYIKHWSKKIQDLKSILKGKQFDM